MIEQAKKLQRNKGLTNLTWRVAAVPPLPFDDDADMFITTKEQSETYNGMEKLRDPSHVRALLLDELTELFSDVGLGTPKVVFYKQPMALQPLLEGSFPNPGDEDQVRQIFVEYGGKDALGLVAHWKDSDIHFSYPIAMHSCSKT